MRLPLHAIDLAWPCEGAIRDMVGRFAIVGRPSPGQTPMRARRAKIVDAEPLHTSMIARLRPVEIGPRRPRNMARTARVLPGIY